MNAKTTRTTQHDAAKAAATRAGDMIRYFLDGGNGHRDNALPTPDHVAAMVLAKLDGLLDPDTHTALITAAGFSWGRTPMGQPVVVVPTKGKAPKGRRTTE